ncbi:MAG: DUF1828 domain-containing protein [Actinobacteria bacterium]|nr:DUF1828 domain-containing protein [Actinomycetota bacterium]OPZ77805.1 MAG: hypothetical protein BWY79_01023 [Actinobacteria bacterium ADurb.Bin444]
MNATEEFQRLERAEILALLAGDREVLARFGSPCALAGATPFSYPGKGPVVLFLESDGSEVRASDGGRLIKFLESQGQDLSIDPVLSRTVFHAVREVAGMGMGNGMVYMDTTLDRLAEDLARFVQAVIEIIGLRHSKYKDALVQLSRTRDGSEPSYWGEF